jgi:serine/threonine-protein kinase
MQSSSEGRERETVVRVTGHAMEQAPACGATREIVAGSGPHLTKETQPLLHRRLAAAALILLVGFGVFLVWHVAGVLACEPRDNWLLGFHTLVVIVLFVGFWLLWQRYPASMAKLRLAELVIFGLPASYFVLVQHRWALIDAARGFASPPLSFWVLLIFTYGMFIPNTWRRAAIVIGALAFAPVLLLVGVVVAYPSVAAVMTPVIFLHHVLVMMVAGVAAVFGTQLINSLRHDAFEARQLGQYHLIAPIGAGAMGEVYLAEHSMLKRPCAIKLIRPERAGDPQVLARFEHEVRMTARLSHWNTVEIFDYGRTQDGALFYVMEYLPGLNLEQILDRHGPLPAARVIHLLRQACQGLREAHSIGLIHRDIKPANLFAAQRGGMYDVVKVLDFGLVKDAAGVASARLSQEGAISGTPLFMSPEQASGAGVDARSDIYSLGAVAYMLLSGRPPFERPSTLEVLFAHARDQVEPPSRFRADVPDDLERVILRCLAKDPQNRYQDTRSLERALAQCAAADEWTQDCAARWWQANVAATEPRVFNDDECLVGSPEIRRTSWLSMIENAGSAPATLSRFTNPGQNRKEQAGHEVHSDDVGNEGCLGRVRQVAEA